MFTNQEYKLLAKAEQRKRLKEIVAVFLKLGAVAFGGPAAHIAMMDDELVQKRKWLTRERFADLIGAVNLIPGPNSTELAIHIGFVRGGAAGLFIAGAAFILPAMGIVLAFAMLYTRYGALPQVSGILYGVKPVIMAIVLHALVRLAKTIIKGWLPLVLAAAVVALSFLGLNHIPLLAGAGVIAMLFKNWEKLKGRMFSLALPLAFLAPAAGGIAPLSGSMPLHTLFLSFWKIGSVLYGSGYVLLAFLEAEFVRGFAVITSRQLLDAVAVGQFTPGPVFTTATFIGYLIRGIPGAIMATLGIFLTSFLLVLLLNPLIPKLRKSAWVSGALDGVNAASLGLMAVVSVKLGIESLTDPLPLGLFLVSFALMMKFKFNTAWAILLGGAIGLAVQYLG